MGLGHDLCEGGNTTEMRKRVVSLVSKGVQWIVLPALNDEGIPSYTKTFWQVWEYRPLPAHRTSFRI